MKWLDNLKIKYGSKYIISNKITSHYYFSKYNVDYYSYQIINESTRKVREITTKKLLPENLKYVYRWF